MEYRYKPQGVCSTEIIVEVENNIIKNLKVINGCNGNLQGIASLVKGMTIDDVIAKLKGMPLWLMKDLFLSESTKPHIGKRFKPVMFFWLDEWPENLDEFYNLILKRKYRFSLKFMSDEKAKKWAKEMISEYYNTILSDGKHEFAHWSAVGSPERLKRCGFKIKRYTY